MVKVFWGLLGFLWIMGWLLSCDSVSSNPADSHLILVDSVVTGDSVEIILLHDKQGEKKLLFAGRPDKNNDEFRLVRTDTLPENFSLEVRNIIQGMVESVFLIRVEKGEIVEVKNTRSDVEKGNSAPVFIPVELTPVPEGETLEIQFGARDPENDSLFYACILPELVYNQMVCSDQNFIWTPGFDQAGSYSFKILVSDGRLSDTLELNIIVSEKNRAPQFEKASPLVFTEGQIVQVQFDFSDPDGDLVAMELLNLPEGGRFDGKTLTWPADAVQPGDWKLDFSFSDGKTVDTSSVVMTVRDQNFAPVWESPGKKELKEGDTLRIKFSATDKDGDKILFSALDFPEGFRIRGDSALWVPGYKQAGEYSFQLIASDTQDSSNTEINIKVIERNALPEFKTIAQQRIQEDQLLTLPIEIKDPDGTNPEIIIVDLPPGAGLNGNVLRWQPDYEQAGAYTLQLKATDGIDTVSFSFDIIVLPTNRKPTLTTSPSVKGTEGQWLTLDFEVHDPDEDAVRLYSGNLPEGARVQGNTLVWKPLFWQAGKYNLEIWASDGKDSVGLVVGVEIIDVNGPPELSDPGIHQIGEDSLFEKQMIYSDPDRDSLDLQLRAQPLNSDFRDGVFRWKPGFNQSGEYVIVFTLTDGIDTVEKHMEITVVNVNRPPVLQVQQTLPETLSVGEAISFAIKTSDPDGTQPFLIDPVENQDAPLNAVFSRPESGKGLFYWKPDQSQVGKWGIVFTAVDSSEAEILESTSTWNLEVVP